MNENTQNTLPKTILSSRLLIDIRLILPVLFFILNFLLLFSALAFVLGNLLVIKSFVSFRFDFIFWLLYVTFGHGIVYSLTVIGLLFVATFGLNSYKKYIEENISLVNSLETMKRVTGNLSLSLKVFPRVLILTLGVFILTMLVR